MGEMLRFLDLTNWIASGDAVSPALFQTNVVQSANTGKPWYSDSVDTALGTPTQAVQAALDHFDIATIRFPGGETDLVFSGGLLQNGDLSPNIVNILSFAAENGISVDMVVPVDAPEGFTRAEFLSQVRDFAIAVEHRFPGTVGGYELGNEYWGGRLANDASLEFDYGLKAGQVAAALSQAMQGAGYDADIFLQASGNLRGAFGNNPDLANAQIQRGFEQTEGALEALDGIIRNSYWRDPETDGFENDSGLFLEDRGLQQTVQGTTHAWEAWAGRDLIERVGEYNINRNIALGEDRIDIGIHGASYLLEHVENLIDAGIDEAFAWPLSHNTQNAYLFRDEDIAATRVHDLEIATNTTRAAMLDLLRQTLTDHQLVTGRWTLSPTPGGANNDVEVTLFEESDGVIGDGRGEQVVFLSSRSDQPMTVQADLSAFVTGFDTLRAISIRYAETGGNLRDAVVTELVPTRIGDGAVFELDLQPYEVVQFVFDRFPPEEPADPALDPVIDDLPPPEPGTADLARIWGGAENDTLVGSAGDDAIFARDGDDQMAGKAGADLLRGGNGNDTLLGGKGADTLFGDLGRDRLDGNAGADRLDGGYGRDTLDGGTGKDTLVGGSDEDTFVHADADRGFDVILDFQIGLDSLVFDAPAFTGPETIRMIAYDYNDTPSTLIRFVGADGAIDRSLGGIVLNGIVRPTLEDLNASFPQQVEAPPAPQTTSSVFDDILALLAIDPATLPPEIAEEEDLATFPF
ncbi:calcium-binding protein [Roseicyclus marinus]|uniref:calcium-binding protein n=1 Tax=Roseicyclus marinus TaxID=2161673 RepID=UPI0024102443|nr:calcium-binding protein [Roseicyclus marinus]MDG3040999.1 calcium-binding protein [Roseicyclus marinus]